MLLTVVNHHIGDGLGSKEIIWALQQIARLDAQGLVDVMTKKQFEDSFLEMLYKLCTTAELPQVLDAAACIYLLQGYLKEVTNAVCWKCWHSCTLLKFVT